MSMESLEQLEAPSGAQEWFIGLAAVAFMGMASFIFAYGLYGEVLTDGLDQACAEAALLAGQGLEEAGNYEPALLRYREAMAGHFADPNRRYDCGIAIGDLLMRQQRYAEAVAAYEDLPQEAFRTAGNYTGYVTALWRGGELENAERIGLRWLEMAQADRNDQQIEWANATLLRIAEAQGNYPAAIAYGEAVVAGNPSSDAQLILARIRAHQGDEAGALAAIDAFIASSTDGKLLSDARRLRERIAGQS